MAINKQDSLGISPEEDLQIKALSLGASPEEVASLSRQKVEDIPQQFPISDFDDTTRDSEVSDFEPVVEAMSPREAARKGVYASLLSEGDKAKDYSGMYDQFTSVGSSSIYDTIKSELRAKEERELDQLTRDVAKRGDVNSTQALLEAREQLLQESANVTSKALENAAGDFLERHMTPSVIEAQQKFLEENTETVQVNEKINQIIDSAVASGSSSLVDFWGNAAEQSFLGEQIFALSKVGKDVLGERYNFQAGTMLRDLAQHLRNTPLEQRETEAQKIVDAFIKHSSPLIGREKNDVIKTFALEQFREFVNTPGGDRVFDRWLANIIGYSEISTFISAGVLTKTLRRLGKIMKSSSSVGKVETITTGIARANPDVDATLKAAALADENTAAKLGTSQAEALQSVLPGNHLGDDMLLEGAPNSVVEKLNLLKTKAQQAEEFIDNTFLYAPEDYAAKQKRISDILEDKKIVARTKPSHSSIRMDDNGNNLLIKAMYGDDGDLPLSLEKATRLKQNLNEALKSEGVEESAQLMVRDPLTRSYEPYNPQVHDASKSDFLVSVDAKAKFGYNDIMPGEILGEGSTKGVGSVVGQTAASWINDPQSYINSRLLGAARVANDQKHLKAHELLSIAKPFLNLNYLGQKRVVDLLNKGEEAKKVFNYSELKGKYSQAEITAYYSNRLFNDTIYRIKNADLRDDLVNRNFKSLSVKSGDDMFVNSARPATPKEISEIQTVFDPVQGGKVQLTEDLQDGLQVVKLLRPVDLGGESLSFAIVRSDDMAELPANVLNYSPGYNFRINNDPYFIDKIERKIVDGKEVPEHRTTIGVARTREEANAWAEELMQKEGGKGLKFEPRLDRNINSVASTLENDIDLLEGSGLQFYFSRRGDRLQRRDNTLSSVEDPVTAINRLTASVANVKTHAELIDTSVIRHRQTYGDLEVNGTKLWTFDTLKNDFHFNKDVAKRGKGNPAVAAALNEYEYLEQLKYSPTAVDQAWKDVLEKLDTFVGSKPNVIPFGLGAKARTALIKSLSQTSPGRVARGTAFALTIPLRPLRHLVLQGSTGLSLAGIDPIGTARSFRDAPLMMMSMATWQNPKLWKQTKAAAKAFGYSGDEWEEMFESFRKSGKAYSIDSHVAVGEANFSWSRSMPESWAGWVANKAANLAKSPITVGKAIGFDTGELMNQAVTWRFAVDQWKRANPGKNPFKSQRVMDEINQSARGWSVDMTRTNAAGYQTGAFASMTQFMAINHKMLFRMIGKDPNIQGWDRVKYTIGMLAMYGAAGVGMQDFYDSWVKETGVEIPPELDDALYGGFTQALFNKSLDLAFGNERGATRTALADSFSPASGVVTFLPEFAANIVDMNVAELLAGPSGSIIPNVGKAANYSLDMWGRDDLDTSDKLFKSLDAATREFGAFSDYFKLNLAMAYKEKADQMFIVSRDGRPSIEANSWQEVWAKALLGLNTRGEQELYNKYLEMYREVNSSGKASTAQIDKDAKHLVKYMYEEWAKSSDPFDFVERVKPITFALHKADRVYGLKVQEAALRQFSMDPQFERFVTQIIENFSLLDADADFRSMKNAVRNSDALQDEDKQTMIDAIEAMELSSEAGRDLINTVTEQELK